MLKIFCHNADKYNPQSIVKELKSIDPKVEIIFVPSYDLANTIATVENDYYSIHNATKDDKGIIIMGITLGADCIDWLNVPL